MAGSAFLNFHTLNGKTYASNDLKPYVSTQVD